MVKDRYQAGKEKINAEISKKAYTQSKKSIIKNKNVFFKATPKLELINPIKTFSLQDFILNLYAKREVKRFNKENNQNEKEQ